MNKIINHLDRERRLVQRRLRVYQRAAAAKRGPAPLQPNGKE